MIPGLRGSLLSHEALEGSAFVQAPESDAYVAAAHALTSVRTVIAGEGGPAWSARTVFDRIALPFARAVGLELLPVGGTAEVCIALATSPEDSSSGRGRVPLRTKAAVVLATGWGREPGTGWRESVRAGIAAGVRWCYLFTGPALRIFDAERTHTRRHLELDLAAVVLHPTARAVVWNLLRGDRHGSLEAAVTLSERHRVAVRDSLQVGVEEALQRLTSAFAAAARRRSHSRSLRLDDQLLDESLIVIYRVLFLLFAEARGLVPLWHPVYRDGYTVEALRAPVERASRPGGIWEALQAMARLAHRGCRAGALRVPPFNGRLFSPAHAPLADSAALDDAAVRDALLALTTRRTPAGRQRIAYADLGVEQLGGVYERVLDYRLAPGTNGSPKLTPGGRRKATGTFYTPRSMTEYLVRRTLAPLVQEAGPDAILRLRILDPAMGSGAFLVAACRYLAHAYEEALLREGLLSPSDVTDDDRAGFRRIVAQRALFGVDRNPMAVQLARLSLWLATLSKDRPLTFFDHHLRVGNSLVGASLQDVASRRAGRQRARAGSFPLLDLLPDEGAMGSLVSTRQRVLEGAEDTLEQVRAKEALLSSLLAPDAPLTQWKRLADLWCAAWFDPAAATVNRQGFAALADCILGRSGGLTSPAADDLLQRGRPAAERGRFFHWELEFPEVFHARDGSALPAGGFDAILGNPPWEMLRADDPESGAADGRDLTRFVRGSGIYRLQGSGHANLYQAFLERSLGLTRPGGRLGLVLPSGIASDHGCAALRRHLLDATTIDAFSIVENREALFPIHRGLKFVLLTLTRTPSTQCVPLRTGITSAGEFEHLPSTGRDRAAVDVPRALVEQVGGEGLAIPEIRSPADAAVAAHLVHAAPAAGDPAGWGLKFGRELNATDDRRHFTTDGCGVPVIEGKQVNPFSVDVPSSSHRIPRERLGRLLPASSWDRPRLAYRDVAASTNRLTLIAAILPAGVVTTHTLFCLKTPLDEEAQLFLAGVFNSFVANYYVRLRVTTHVTVSIVERLPVPRPDRAAPSFAVITGAARRLGQLPADEEAADTLQAEVARLYRLDRAAFAHILGTFPLVERARRDAALAAFGPA